MTDKVRQYDVILDVREDRCPMPLLKTKLALSKMQEGEILCVITGDKGSLKDIPHYLSMVGQTLVDQKDDGDLFTFLICKSK